MHERHSIINLVRTHTKTSINKDAKNMFLATSYLLNGEVTS